MKAGLWVGALCALVASPCPAGVRICGFLGLSPRVDSVGGLRAELERRLGPAVLRDAASVSPTDLLVVKGQPEAMLDYGRRALGTDSLDRDFADVEVFRGRRVSFSISAWWGVHDGRPEPGSLAPHLGAREFARFVAELYDLTGHRPRERHDFSVDLPGGKEKFSTLVLSLPTPMPVLGRNFEYRTTDAIAVTIDGKGNVVGVTAAGEGFRELGLSAAIHHLASLPRVRKLAETHEKRRERLARDIEILARWLSDTDSPWTPELDRLFAEAPRPWRLHPLWENVWGGITPGSVVGALSGTVVGALASSGPAGIAAGGAVTVLTSAALGAWVNPRARRYRVIEPLVRLLDRKRGELEAVPAGHAVLEAARVEGLRRKENTRNLLDPLIGAGVPRRLWRPSDPDYARLWETLDPQLSAPEAQAVLTVLRRAEGEGISGDRKARLISILSSTGDVHGLVRRAEALIDDKP